MMRQTRDQYIRGSPDLSLRRTAAEARTLHRPEPTGRIEDIPGTATHRLFQDAVIVARRGMDGLVRRARAVHKYDRLVVSPEVCATALGPLERILGAHRGCRRGQCWDTRSDHRAVRRNARPG